MNRTTKRLTAILLALCLLFGGVGLAPEIASTSGSLIAKAKVKKYTRYVKTSTLKVHKKASASSKVVATLKKDKKVTQYGSANKKGWVKIRYKKNQYGYVKRSDLAKQPDIKGMETKAIKKLKKIAEDYGWELDYELYDSKESTDGYLDTHYQCRFDNEKYYMYITIFGETTLIINAAVFTTSDNDIKAKEDLLTSADDVKPLFKKYSC